MSRGIGILEFWTFMSWMIWVMTGCWSTNAGDQWWAKWWLSTFDLYPWGEGHGVQGQICDILRPQLAMNRFLPLWPHRFPHFGCLHLGGGGVGRLWYQIDVEHSTYLQVSMPTSAGDTVSRRKQPQKPNWPWAASFPDDLLNSTVEGRGKTSV